MSAEFETVIPLTMARLKFGLGATDELGYELTTMGAGKVLLVADGHLWAHGLVDKVKTIIEDEGIGLTIYDQIQIEPTDASLRQAIEFARGVELDAFVALGGGSTIDTAKAMNLFTTYPADLYEYINPPIGKGRPVPGPLRPMVALPTTAGTGAETTAVLVVDLLDLHLKTGISSNHCRPTMAIVDPLNTLTTSPQVTASCGLDVVTHAAESFTIKPYNKRPKSAHPGQRGAYVGANPISDLWSEKAIEWAGTYLRRAVKDGHDLEARTYMAMGSTFAGIGYGNAGVHIPHALGYPIAGMVKEWAPEGYGADGPLVPHGFSTALTAPACFRFTASTDPRKHARIAELLAIPGQTASPQTRGLKEISEKLPEAITHLLRDVGCPNGLAAVGYTEVDLDRMVEGGWKQQRLLVGSPRPVTQSDLRRILEDSMVLW